MTHPFLTDLKPTLHISHRGGAALAPENTMTAFEMAVRLYGTQVLELDVHVTRDGEVVVAHDPTVDRCTEGTGEIAALDWADLSRLDAGYRFTSDGGQSFPFRGKDVRIPRLGDVLGTFADQRLNIEVKADAPGVEMAVAAVVRAHDAESRVCIGSEDDALAARVVAALPRACHFYPRRALTDLVLALREGHVPADVPFQVLDMPLYFGEMRLVDERFFEQVRGLGRWVNVWTVDEADEMRTLVRERVGGIMTDRPDVLRQVLDESVDPPS